MELCFAIILAPIVGFKVFAELRSSCQNSKSSETSTTLIAKPSLLTLPFNNPNDDIRPSITTKACLRPEHETVHVHPTRQEPSVPISSPKPSTLGMFLHGDDSVPPIKITSKDCS